MVLKNVLWALIGLVLTATVASAQEQPHTFTADAHKAVGVTCANCHGEEKPKTAANGQQCISCHKSFEILSKKTADMEPNPHGNHYIQDTDPDCAECHQGHKADKVVCTQCHDDMTFKRHPTAAKKAPAAPAAPITGTTIAYGALFYVSILALVLGVGFVLLRKLRGRPMSERSFDGEIASVGAYILSRRWIYDAPLAFIFRALFCAGLFLVLVRHLRYFVDPAWVGGFLWRAVEIAQPFGFYAGAALIVGALGCAAVRFVSGPSSGRMMAGLRLALFVAVPVSGYATWFRHSDVLQVKDFFVGLLTGHFAGLPTDSLLLLHLWLVAALLVALALGGLTIETAVGTKRRIMLGGAALAAVLVLIPAGFAVNQLTADGWARPAKADFTTLAKTHMGDDPMVMIRNHSAFLMHQQDLVIHKGVRVPGDSLERCVTCHVKKDAAGQPVGFENSSHFCTSCHVKVAVTTDCFECHNSKPQISQPSTASNPVGSAE